MVPYKIKREKVYSDRRGAFEEVIRSSEIGSNFKQMNIVYSNPNVVRGLHYQVNKPQGKFVGVLEGFIQDVAVSPAGEVFIFNLGPGDKVYIPPGYAHGYRTLNYLIANIYYLCTEEYDPSLDRGWNPFSASLPDLPWHGVENLIISDKDKNAPEFQRGVLIE